MKPNTLDKKQKKTVNQQNKIDEKKVGKDNNQLTQNNKKQKHSIQLSESVSSISSPKNKEKSQKEKGQKKDKRRVLSVSQEKDRSKDRGNSQKKNEKKNRKPRNLSMDRNLNYSLKNKKTLETKKNDKEEKKEVNPLIENYDPNLYGFNLYRHIKENLQNRERLCQDNLTKDSLYCADCKVSTCQKCSTFKIHKGHNLIPKYLYYDSDPTVFKDTFKDIDGFLEENPDFKDNKKIKEELKKVVTDSIDKIIKRLNEVKKKKLKQLDDLFESTDDYICLLRQKKENIQKDIKKYIEKQKAFYYIQISDENSDKDNEGKNAQTDDKNLKKNDNNESEKIKNNNDTYNTAFLINYDLMKNTSYINSEISKILNDIKINKEKYLNEFNEIIKQINEDIDKLYKEFNGRFNYSDLNFEFYKMVSDKLNKYNEKIDAMKKYIFDMTNKDKGFSTIEKDNFMAESSLKQRFDNILNNQILDDNPEGKNNKDKDNHRLSMYINEGLPNLRLKNTLQALSESKEHDPKNYEGNLPTIYETLEEIKLNKEVLQKYFAFETYNTIHNHFRYKKPKPVEKEIIVEVLDDEIETVKPVPGSNEILLYDRKNTTLTKKVVNFDKKKHKYLYFLIGCRCALVKEKLYILGGVDKDSNVTKMAYVYSIRTNELKAMPEMIKPHAYHAVSYLDYYKAILVVGGENSAACEIFDLNTGSWKELPDMNLPRAQCNLYLDKYNHIVYSFFGVVGDIIEKNNYTDIIECLELRRIASGWNVIDYENKAEMDFKSGFTKILPLSNEMVLIYGAINMRNIVKKAAIYLIPKFEIVKIDNKIFKEIKEKSKNSKNSRKLSKILSTYL